MSKNDERRFDELCKDLAEFSKTDEPFKNRTGFMNITEQEVRDIMTGKHHMPKLSALKRFGIDISKEHL